MKTPSPSPPTTFYIDFLKNLWIVKHGDNNEYIMIRVDTDVNPAQLSLDYHYIKFPY